MFLLPRLISVLPAYFRLQFANANGIQIRQFQAGKLYKTECFNWLRAIYKMHINIFYLPQWLLIEQVT